ncbi:C13 family peptidase, partial [Thermodesulfobacteriota bacterium]
AVDQSGYVYVTDTVNNRVQKFTSEGTYVAQWGTFGTGDGQFDRPLAIEVDASGNVYVADTFNNRVQKFTSDGAFVTKWGTYGEWDGTSGTQGGQFHLINTIGGDSTVWGNGIAVDKNGNVFVVDVFNSRVQKFDANGNYLDQWGGYPFSPMGITIGPTGFIYIADPNKMRIQKFTPDFQYVTEWGSTGTGDGKFDGLNGLAVSADGYVYISDVQNGRVQKFDANGQFLSKWSTDEWGGRPAGVATGSNGNVYVAVGEPDNLILKFDASGNLINQWGGTGTGNGQFDIICCNGVGMAFDAADNLYVVDIGNNRIQKFNASGNYLGQWGSYGTAAGQFSFRADASVGIAMDKSAGYLYVADPGNKRIQKFDLNGNYQLSWQHPDWTTGSNDPFGVTVDSNGDVFVADGTPPNLTFTVKKFDSDGNYLYGFSKYGTAPGQQNNPYALTFGPNSKLYVADTFNNRVQVFKKVTSLPNSKAIVVAGGGPFTGNNLWAATESNANFTYRTLTYQGFTKGSIYYLSSDTDLDLDNNGILDDVDYDATNANLQNAITSWAVDAESLVIYLVDHGGDGTFRMSGTETLSVSDLDAWLDQLQQTMPGKVTVIYDACESGSFVSALTPPTGKERVVITSTSPNEQAYFVTQGSVSFSNYFWTHIFNGVNVKDAFGLSKNALSTTTAYQHPLLDSSGNGVGNETEDYTLTQSFYIGNGTTIYGDSPVIGPVSDPQTISGINSAPLFAADVTDNDGIARVWAVIRPPDYNQGASSNPVNDLPFIDLFPVGGNRYEATYDGFNIEGTYQIAIYARDQIGNTSIPELTSVSVNNPLRRRAIIALGGSQSDAIWPAMENLGTLAYESLTFQGYSVDDIFFMSPVTFSTGVDGLTTLSNLSYAVNVWSLTNTQDVAIYLIGEGGTGTFELNATETLTASTLDSWIDNLQNNITGKVTVIYDAPKSGSFLPLLTPPADRERILISSTAGDGPAHFISEGNISFSKFFWRRVLDGMNVRDAFINAKNAISYCQNQVPQLDDNNNGIGNEKIDGIVAMDYSIGFGIMLAGDDPLIGSVSPSQTIGENTATIFAQEVTTTGTIEKVWAVITPSGFSSDSSDPVTDLPSIELSSVGNGRYEADYSYFRYTGTYDVSVYAIDNQGNMAVPKNTTVTRTGGLDLSTDADNDGITDANEDVNHNAVVDTDETDQNNIDTDGDGVQDGTEMGLTLNDIGSGTDTNIFQPDLDSSSATDPLNADTDGDGFSDGREDRNFNGKVDINEGDPNNPGSTPKPLMPWLPLLLGD